MHGCRRCSRCRPRLAVLLPRFEIRPDAQPWADRPPAIAGGRPLKVIYDEMQRWRDEPDVKPMFDNSDATTGEVAVWLAGLVTG